MKDFEKKISVLKTTTDGIKFCNTLDLLEKNKAKMEEKEYSQYIQCLVEYAFNGPITFHRSHALSTVIDSIENCSKKYANEFLELMNCGDTNVEYWAVSAYAMSMGKDGYDHIVSFILSTAHSLNSRCKAVKEIALLSKQCFDMGKPVDPGYWKESDLDINHILEWQKRGYPDGEGYPLPKTHESLISPKTTLEKTMANMEVKLKLKRDKRQDPANPTNWLTIGNLSEIEKIKNYISPYELPEEYENFLRQYSPIKCSFKIKRQGEVDIYSTSNLLENQQGYSLSGDDILPDWPKGYLVIADSNADPFCFDLSQKNSPVYFAYHGEGDWDFEECYKDFLSFIKSITVF